MCPPATVDPIRTFEEKDESVRFERIEFEQKMRGCAASFQSVSELISVFDNDDRLVLFNRSMSDSNQGIRDTFRIGATFEEIIRALVLKGLLTDAVGREESWLEERIARHREPDEPFEICREGGQVVLVREQRLADGGTITIGRDVTEQKRAEHALFASEQRFRTLIEYATHGILVHSDGELLYANRSLATMLGYDSAADVLALETVASCLPSDEQQRLGGKAVARRQGGNPPERYEFRTFKRDSGEIWLEIHSVPLTWEGRSAILATLTDVTDRRLAIEALSSSEQRFRDFTDASSDWLWETDSDHRFVNVEGSPPQGLGLELEHTLGKTRLELGAPGDDFSPWLRVRPETLCRITEFSEHESNGRELDEGERVAVEVLPVLGQSAAAVEPGDGAFDHPTPGLDDEALHPIGSLDDLGLEIGQDAGQGAVKDRALIGAVGEQFPEKGKQTEQGRRQRETAVAILNVGGGDDAVQQHALRIDQNMPLLALDQLAGIEAVAVDASPPFSALFTL